MFPDKTVVQNVSCTVQKELEVHIQRQSLRKESLVENFVVFTVAQWQVGIEMPRETKFEELLEAQIAGFRQMTFVFRH